MNRLALTLAIATFPSLAAAEVEISGTAGLHVFSKTNGLGVPDEADANSLKNSALFGARLGVYFGAIGVEAEGGLIPTEPRETVFDVYTAAFRANLVYQFRGSESDNKILPFVLAGGGAIRVVNSAREDLIMKESILALHAGGGAKYRAQNDWGVRLDVRGLFVPSSEGGNTFDAEILMSIYKEFGRKKKVAPKAEPPKSDDDPDKDGIVGDADKCATEPEDMDSFQDEDGCPDPDNDADGVPDAADKCIDQAETKNGFEDDDGCPDEIPEKVRQFTGVIQGIQFKTSSADLIGGSTKTLDKAVAVMAEFKDIKLEIQGHTDDTTLRNNKVFADNDALSQARAESVKAYFVGKGIDEARLIAKGLGSTAPVEDPTGLKGGKLNAARAKNRRVEFKLVTGGPAAPDAPTE